jgi:hypothetical protein
MSAPALNPNYHTRSTNSADAYHPGARVWIHRSGAWRPGVVLQSSVEAVTVRYRPAEGRGTGVDTVNSRSLAIRDDVDPVLD